MLFRKIDSAIYLALIMLRRKLAKLYYEAATDPNKDRTFSAFGLLITERYDDPYYYGYLAGSLNEFALYLDAVQIHASASPVILDIGANIGITAMLFSKAAGSQFHAFKPVKRTFGYLSMNILNNGLTNINAHNIAVSNERGEIAIGERGPGEDRGSFGILNGAAADSRFRDIVQVTTVDDFVEEQKLDKVDYMKIDVQGLDTNVLKGAEETISRFRPVIQIEVAAVEFERGYFDAAYLRDFPGRHGYRTYFFYRKIRPLESLERLLQDPRAALDVLLVPN